jgi:hypothetical protein
MCSIIAIFLLVVSGLFGYSMVSTQQTINEPQIVEIPVTAEMAATAEAALIPTQVIACPTQSAAQDAAESLQMIDPNIFEPALWTSQGGLEDLRTTTTWRSDKLGAVAYLEFLHFDCGVSADQIDAYFSPESFQTIFSNYTSYQQTASCEHNGIRLFQFDAVSNDANYRVLYWVKQISPTRVADLMLTFPADQQAKLAQYAGRLFPNLPTCSEAGG